MTLVLSVWVAQHEGMTRPVTADEAFVGRDAGWLKKKQNRHNKRTITSKNKTAYWVLCSLLFYYLFGIKYMTMLFLQDVGS